MVNLEFSIVIPTGAENVWEALTSHHLYPQWAKAFSVGSQFEGVFKEGETICFFDPALGGTEALVQKLVPHKRISLKHQAIFDKNLKRDTESESAKKWIGSEEDYFLKEEYGSTRVEVEVFIHEDHQNMFNKTWPKALELLKDVAVSLRPPEAAL